MNSRERVIKTLNFEKPDRLPRHMWILASGSMNFPEEVKKLLKDFPQDFVNPPYNPPRMPCQVGTVYENMVYVDEWNCRWEAKEPGVIGEVVDSPIKTWSDLDTYKPPFELIGKGMEEVNRFCAESDKFVLSGCCPRPFERIQFLRGAEQLYLDLAYGEKELFKMIEMVHDYHLREVEEWVKTDVDGITFMDDWGSQKSLLISPKMWEEIFKPLYKDYVDIVHAHGKYSFMHSDGMIEAIYPGLIDVGFDALNSQLFCMNFEKLCREYGGKITFWGEIDRQRLLPFGTREEVVEGVTKLIKACSHFDGGLIAQCEWEGDGKPENIRAVFETFDKYAIIVKGYKP